MLSSLSASEMQTLCGDFTDYLVQEASVEYTKRRCVQAAFLAQSLSTDPNPSQVCRDKYNACMAESATVEATSGITIAALCPSPPATTLCLLTVSDYIDCLDQLSVAAKAAWALRQNLCDDLVSCSGTCSSPIVLPSACVLVRDTCFGMIPTVAYATYS